jgi:anti-sigma factor RsiW
VADRRDAHADHDPIVIARLLDRDVPADERVLAESLIASCTSCAALHADLVALAAATRAQSTPALSRSFTLTRDDAARLAAQPAGEPVSASSRLGGVMTVPSTASEHASHDTILVASLADHSLPAGERAAAEALVAGCSECADLQADLLALRAATRAMPTPARPADYTLSASDAARLRTGGWRGFVSMLGSSRDALSRPLAVGLTTLGLAGLLISAAPSFMLGSASSGAAPTTAGAPAGGAAAESGEGSNVLGAKAPPMPAASAAAAAAASAPPVVPAPGDITGSTVDQSPAPGAEVAPIADAGATPPPDGAGFTNGAARTQATSPGGTSGQPDTTSDLLAAQEIGGVSPLVVVSIALLVTGLALFALRWAARRFGT